MINGLDELRDRLKSGKFLQVALDFIDLDQALKVAKDADRAGVDIVEVGTPMVKAYGIMGALEIGKAVNKPILLDTKTADAGDVEAEIARRAGAKIMTVLGAMDDSTIDSAVRKAHEYGILVQVDMLNVTDVSRRARRVVELGADIVGLHVGLDVQKSRGISVADLKDEIKEVASTGVIVSVAGGLNRERILTIIDAPINIFVVGGAITKSPDPYKATLEIVKILKGNA